MGHARLAAGGETVQGRTTEHHAVGPECERLEDIGAAAKSAVDEHGEPIVDRRGHLAENLDASRGAIKLPSAVVGHDDAVGAAFDGAQSILDAEDPFEQKLAFPACADPLD